MATCRCSYPIREDGMCRNRCPPPGKAPRRKRSVGRKEKRESLLTVAETRAAAKRIGLPSPLYDSETPQGAAASRGRKKAARR